MCVCMRVCAYACVCVSERVIAVHEGRVGESRFFGSREVDVGGEYSN